MSRTKQFAWLALVAAGVTAFGGDVVVEGNLAVTSNVVSRTLCAANATVDVLVVNSQLVLPGAGSAGIAREGISAAKAGWDSKKPDKGDADGGKSAHAEWERWGDGRYLCKTGIADLAVNGPVTAWKFVGDGSGLTNLDLAAYAGNNLVWDPASNKLNAAAAYHDSNAVAAVLAGLPWLAEGAGARQWSGGSAGLDAAEGRASLGLGSAATNEASAFAPADLSLYASETVRFIDGQLHAVSQVSSEAVSNVVLAVFQEVGLGLENGLTTSGGTMTGPLNMNGSRVTGLPAPLTDSEAATKGFLRQVLSHLPPQGNLSMGAFTNGAPASFPLSF